MNDPVLKIEITEHEWGPELFVHWNQPGEIPKAFCYRPTKKITVGKLVEQIPDILSDAEFWEYVPSDGHVVRN